MPKTPWLLIAALTVFLRFPYLDFPVQGDDAFYLAMAQQALVDPAHPNHFRLIAQGTQVDMRGFPKPPGNAWILAGAIAASGGEIREPVLHGLYAGFTALALWAVWHLATAFCALPHWGLVVFAAMPAFVINGNSLEADKPFVSFFLAAMALLVRRSGTRDLLLAALYGALAALIEYKAIFLAPLGVWYAYRSTGGSSNRARMVAAALAPAVVLAAWQLYERASTGASGAEVLAGYFQSRNLQSGANKLRNALALTVHLGWIVSPLITLAGFARADLAVAAAVGLAGALLHDASPLFWLPLGIGAALVVRVLRGLPGFIECWIAGFYVFALVVFFAGSARYLLPLGAPLAFLAVNRLDGKRRLAAWLTAGAASHFVLALALNHANYEMWQTYRETAGPWIKRLGEQRSWVAGDWGLRFYAESEGAAPLQRGQSVRPGDAVIASRLGQPIDYATGGGIAVPLSSRDVQPSVRLRLFGAGSPSAYSFHGRGLRAFDVSAAPADTITLVQIAERAPVLSYLPMNAPEAAFQIASGAYALEDNAWRWTARRVVAILKRPSAAAHVEATFRIIDASPVRAVRLFVDGAAAAEGSYGGAGLYSLRTAAPVAAAADAVTVTLVFDQAFSPPNDARELAVILTGLGFR